MALTCFHVPVTTEGEVLVLSLLIRKAWSLPRGGDKMVAEWRDVPIRNLLMSSDI